MKARARKILMGVLIFVGVVVVISGICIALGVPR